MSKSVRDEPASSLPVRESTPRASSAASTVADARFDVLLLAGPLEVRGSCAYSLRLAERLPAAGIRPRLVTPDAQLVSPGRRAKIELAEFRRLETPAWGRLVRWFLLGELKQNDWQLVHVQSRRALRLGSWLARKLRCPLVLTVHDHLTGRERLPLNRDMSCRVIAVSQSVAADLVDRAGLPESLVTVIPSGVEIPAADACPSPLDPGHVPVIGTAGPLEAVKGFPWFLGAARQVLDVRRDVEFLVAGAGPEESNLRRVARELGIADKVTFVPYVLDFGDALAATDIFCLPSLQQGLGTIMLEAMALARPVIATGVGGVHSIVRDGQTGLIVPPRNSAALAAKMLELLNNVPRARAIGAAARRLVSDEFHVDRMVQQTAELYCELIESSAATGAARLAP